VSATATDLPPGGAFPRGISIVALVATVAALYFGRDVLIPVAVLPPSSSRSLRSA
jgi:hypothetical protein